MTSNHHTTPKGEQNGCRQRLEGYLSSQQRLALRVVRGYALGVVED